MAVVFVTIASVALVFVGEQSFVQRGTNYPELVGFYLLAGLLGGIALGLLRPFARTKVGIVVISMTVAFSVWSAFLAEFVGLRHLQVFDFLTLAFATVVCGPFGAAFFLPDKSNGSSDAGRKKR